MSAEMDKMEEELSVDLTALYREEMISDMKAATFRKMIPVKVDGTDDESRDSFFTAQTTVMSPMGAIPLQAKLEAKDLTEAAAEFPGAIRKAMDKLVEEAREMQRQEASKIVVPGAQPTGNIQI